MFLTEIWRNINAVDHHHQLQQEFFSAGRSLVHSLLKYLFSNVSCVIEFNFINLVYYQIFKFDKK